MPSLTLAHFDAVAIDELARGQDRVYPWSDLNRENLFTHDRKHEPDQTVAILVQTADARSAAVSQLRPSASVLDEVLMHPKQNPLRLAWHWYSASPKFRASLAPWLPSSSIGTRSNKNELDALRRFTGQESKLPEDASKPTRPTPPRAMPRGSSKFCAARIRKMHCLERPHGDPSASILLDGRPAQAASGRLPRFGSRLAEDRAGRV